METIVIVIHIIAAIAIVALVLLQQGKGADAGAAFGSGASQTVFGSAGSGNFLTKSTSIAAAVFFATSLALAIYAKQYTSGGVTTGSPVVNPELLSELPNQNSDVPQLTVPDRDAGDVPADPGN